MIKNCTKININQIVKVRLTEYGRKCLHEDHVRFMSERNLDLSYSPPVEDGEGWSSWQFWRLCEVFGHHMSIDQPNVFEGTILIEDEN